MEGFLEADDDNDDVCVEDDGLLDVRPDAFATHAWGDFVPVDETPVCADGDAWSALDHRPAYVHAAAAGLPRTAHRSSVLAPMSVASAVKKCRKRPGPYLSRPAHSSETQASRAHAAWIRDCWEAGLDPDYANPASTRRPHRKALHSGPWWSTRSRRPKRHRDEPYIESAVSVCHPMPEDS